MKKEEEEEDAGAAVVNEMQRATGLCENIHKPSAYKEYKDIRKEEEDAGAAGLKKQRRR